MKYYKVNETDASGTGYDIWSYYALKDTSTIDDAVEIFEEDPENSWAFEQPMRRLKKEEITKEQYDMGILFNKYYSYPDLYRQMHTDNIFPIYEWAVEFADKYRKVKVGYPNHCLVYRMNDKRELSFQYHLVK